VALSANVFAMMQEAVPPAVKTARKVPVDATRYFYDSSTKKVLRNPCYKTLSFQKYKDRKCAHCGSHATPEWRSGPTGKASLCNACGLRYKKNLNAEKRRRLRGAHNSERIAVSRLLNGEDYVIVKKVIVSGEGFVWENISFSCGQL